MSLRANFAARRGAFELKVAFEVAPGEVVAVLGPNGSGKTSLLRVLAGLQPVATGSVQLGGRVLDDAGAGRFVEPEARRTGFVFQDYLLFPHLTVGENVAFGARGTVGAWLERLGLAGLEDRRPRQLSGGQAQRVALARALASEPELLLLDEPLAALDAQTRTATRRELRRHLADFGGVAVLVTHDPVDAATLAGRVLVLESGRVSQAGTLAEITARPRSAYAAGLAGVNLWRGVAGPDGVDTGPLTVAVPQPAAGNVFVAVHPRAVSIYLERPSGSPRNVWPGRVDSIDAGIAGVRVRVDAGLAVVAEITPAALADLALGGGESVWVSFKASEASVYEV